MPNNLLENFQALSQREKAMIVVAFVLVLWGSWDVFFYTPLQKQQTQLRQRLTTLDTELLVQQQMLIQLRANQANNPNLLKQKQLESLKTQYQQLQDKMRRMDKKFVAPDVMPQVLSDLLKQNQQLKLIKLDTLPVATLQESTQKNEFPIYKHGLVLTFSGNYLAVLKYLQTLEAMPWQFVWDSIDYQVKDYPQAEITLRVYTLSLEKDWLDV